MVVVRFWVDTTFRILSLDVSALGSERLVARVENPTSSTNFTVLASDDLVRPLNQWTALTIVSSSDEPNQIRRIEFQVPPGAGRLFIRLQR